MIKVVAAHGIIDAVVDTFNYFSGSNQIQSVIALPSSGGSGITTSYLRDTADPARMARVSVGAINMFQDQVDSGGYNQEDQIVGRTITRKDANDDGTLTNSAATHYGYTYNASLGDALTAVSVTVNGNAATGYNYGFDQVGNFTGNSTLGSANNVNQYSGLTYNGRGDVTDDGPYAYQYDAQDRLIVATPHDTSQVQVRYGYDSLGRRLWKTVYAYASGTWAASYSRHYLWDGSKLAAELDGNNAVLTGYTWGPLGLLAVTDYTQTTPMTYVVAQDLSGHVDALFDPVSGNPVASFHSDSYGSPLSSSGPKKTLGLFRGKGWLVDPELPVDAFAPNPNGDGSDRVEELPLHTNLQRDPAGEFATMDLYEPFRGDPINKLDPSGETSESILGVVGIRWNDTDKRAEVGLSVAINPSWYNYVIWPVSDYERSHVVSTRWLPINSLPQEYASNDGLRRLADWEHQFPKDRSAPVIIDALQREIQDSVAVQSALIEGHNQAGMLGPTGDGLLDAAMLEAVSGVLKARAIVKQAKERAIEFPNLKPSQTTEELRNMPGKVTVSRPLKRASGIWLDAGVPTAIPAQVADRLKGKKFESFDELRSAIWKEIAANEELNGSFGRASIGNMKDGNAPFAPRAYQTGTSDAEMRFNLHHREPIQWGGGVYDLGNLQIVSPRTHAQIHQ